MKTPPRRNRRTIDLSNEEDEALQGIARSTGSSEDALLRAFAVTFLLGRVATKSDSNGEIAVAVDGRLVYFQIKNRLETIRDSPNVLGGDARVRDTRIPVWLLVAHKKWGESDSEILTQYPSLNVADLTSAWEFYTVNTERVDAERRADEDE